MSTSWLCRSVLRRSSIMIGLVLESAAGCWRCSRLERITAAGLSGDAQGNAAAAEELRQTDGNRFRVYLHRARKKLEKMSGWREGKR